MTAGSSRPGATRRPARGRPDRGGRSHPRARQASHHAALTRAGDRPPDREPAAAPPSGGPAARPRAARGDLVQLHLPGCAGEAAPHRCGAAQGREPAERGPERDAPADPAGTARRGTAQRRPRASRIALFESAHVYLPTGTSTRLEGSDPFTERRLTFARSLTEAAPAGWRTPARRRTSMRSRRCSRR